MTTDKNYIADSAEPVNLNPNYAAALAYLPARGILEKTWKAAHVRIEKRDTAQGDLWHGGTEAQIVFPNLFLDADNHVYPDGFTTRRFPTGVPKFLNPKGSEVRPYVLPDSRRQAKNVDVPAFVVEGPTRALVLAQNDRCAISAGNCWGPNEKQNEADNAVVSLHADLKDWAWLNRHVYLVPDADYRKNESVLQGLIRQIVVFSALGAIVKVITWDAERGKGVDDAVAAQAGCDLAKQTEVLKTLIDGAKDADKFLDPNWVDLFITEFRKVEMTEAKRDQLAKLFAKRFGIPTESLRRVKSGDESNGKVFTLPDIEPWSEPVDGNILLGELETLFEKRMFMTEEQRVATGLWVMTAHAESKLRLLPMLAITSDSMRCGKSTFLEILQCLLERAILVSSLTPATVFRLIEQWHPSLLVDECDTFLNDETSELRGIIDSGHTRATASIPRCVGDNHEVKLYSTWGAKVAAAIGGFPNTITDRSIVIHLIRKDPNHQLTRLREADYPAVRELGRKVKRFIQDNAGSLSFDTRINLANDRAADNWEPLLSIAQCIGSDWYGRAVSAAKKLTDAAEPNEDRDILIRLLQEYTRKPNVGQSLPSRDIFYATEEILAYLNAEREAPWADWRKGGVHGLTAQKLSRMLNPSKQKVGIRSAQVRIGEKVLRGYLLTELQRLFSAYGAPTPPSNTSPDGTGTPLHTPAHQVLDLIPVVTVPIRDTVTAGRDTVTVDQAVTTDRGIGVTAPNGSPDQDNGSGNLNRDLADQVPEPVREASNGVTVQNEGSIEGEGAPPYCYITTDTGLAGALLDIARPGPVGIDIETYFPNAKLTKTGKRIKVAADTICDRFKSKIRLLSLYRDGSDTVWLIDIRSLGETATACEALHGTLAAKAIVGHNVTCFDLPWLWEHLRVRMSQINDTLTADRLLTNGMREPDGTDTKSGLGVVAKRYLDLDLVKDEAKSDWGVPELTMDQLAYAANDVSHLHGLLKAQEAAIAKAELDTAWKLERKLAPVVVNMTNRGFPFNVIGAAAPKAEIEQRLTEAENRARVWFGDPAINLNSWQQLLPAFAAKGVTLSGTSEEILLANGSEGALLLLAYRNIRDKELKFLTGLADATASDGRIHAIFQSTGTDTGRFSCKNPNLQNVPRPSADRYPVRALFQAPAGKKFVIADFSQMELVAGAVIAPEPKMLAAIVAGEDLHRQTASLVLGKPLDEVTKDDRSLSKAINFALLFGQRADGLRDYAKSTYGVDMTPAEATRFRAAFFREYDGLANWHARAWDAVRDPSVTEVRTPGINRRRLLPPIDKRWQRFTTLVNTPVQGGCAEVAKLAMIDIAKRPLADKALLVNTVHDELIIECAESDAPYVRDEVVRIMQKRFADVFKGTHVSVEANIADNWAEKGVKKPEALALAA
jgi:DNA polymerase I